MHGMPEVGERTLRARQVSRRNVELFTEISGGRDPLHYDEAAAQDRSGLYTVALP